MNTSKISPCLRVSLSLAVCLLSVQTSPAAEKVAARTVPAAKEAPTRNTLVSATVEDIEIPQSEFKANPNDLSGRDPFFPQAEYWKPKEKTQQKPDKPKPDEGSAILAPLKLTGVGGIGDRRWAMVNGNSIYLGESAVIRVGGKAYEVVCLEMTDTTVVLGLKDSSARREIKID